MDKFTKEQSSLFTVIAAVLMLLAFFVFNLIPQGYKTVTAWTVLTEGKPGFWGYLILIILLLVPIYLILYAYKDAKPLEPLKPIFSLPGHIVALVPLALIILGIVYVSIEFGIAALWVYLLGAIAVYLIQRNS